MIARRPTTRSTGPGLAIGQFRVFYEVVGEESGIVRILAVGRKVDTLTIGGKEMRL